MPESRTVTIARYNAKTYDELKLRFKKGELDQIRKQAASAGKSLNSYCIDKILEK